MAGNIIDDGVSVPDLEGELLPSPPDYQSIWSGKVRKVRENQGKYGIMYADDYEWSNRRCTRAAYGDCADNIYGSSRGLRKARHRRATAFHTTWMSPEQAAECVAEMPDYPPFNPSIFRGLLTKAVPETSKVVIGRERSPVAYFWTTNPKYVMDLLAADALVEQVADALATTTEAVRAAKPQELGAYPGADHYPTTGLGERHPSEISHDGPVLVRAWWD